MMTALVALFAFVASASAMSYEQARQQALFLTDKMAYELNLTEEQYEAAYEVNLESRPELYSPRLAVSSVSGCHVLLSPPLLERRLLALRHLRPLSAPRLLLFRNASLL